MRRGWDEKARGRGLGGLLYRQLIQLSGDVPRLSLNKAGKQRDGKAICTAPIPVDQSFFC